MVPRVYRYGVADEVLVGVFSLLAVDIKTKATARSTSIPMVSHLHMADLQVE